MLRVLLQSMRQQLQEPAASAAAAAAAAAAVLLAMAFTDASWLRPMPSSKPRM
jgi:hypothetical protein